MKNYWLSLAFSLALSLCLCFPAQAQGASTGPAPAPSKAQGSKAAPGMEMAQLISTVTGIAISPLLGVSAVGCWQYLNADAQQKANLPWYAQPWFFLPALLIVGLVAAKDVLGAATPPGLKKPIDVAETLENKLSGLVATGALLPLITTFLGQPGASASLGGSEFTLAAITGSTFLQIAALPFVLAAYAVVWMAAHAIHVLILLSPWGAVDAVLKLGRTALLSALAGISLIKPAWGAVFSVLLILVAYFIAGWSFRLSVQGWVYCWDFLTGRRHRFEPAADANCVFAARQIGRAPIRSYGRLMRATGGGFEFRYRPWLFLPEQVETLPGGLSVGRAVLHPTLEQGSEESSETLLNFPPRYRGHEDELARLCGLPAHDIGILRGVRALLDGIRALFGFSPRAA